MSPKTDAGTPASRALEDAQAESRPLIRADALRLAYHGKPALLDVELAIHAGRITALIGPSGCGKTSFLLAINRLTDLIPGCRVSGGLRLGELDVLDPRADVVALRRRVGMIFQKPAPFPLSIRDNVALPLQEHGLHRQGALEETIELALRDVGLWEEVKDRLRASALALSGGQQQRLCLARALVLQPEVLLMDEPCSALDPISGGVVEDLITTLRGRYTIVVVTHNLSQARRIADDAALFWLQEGAGRLIESGPARRLFESPQHPLTNAYVTGMRG